jgi:hypothetical protein
MTKSIVDTIKNALESYKIVKKDQILKFYENDKIYEFYVKNQEPLLLNMDSSALDIIIERGDFLPDYTLNSPSLTKKNTLKATTIKSDLDLDLIF